MLPLPVLPRRLPGELPLHVPGDPRDARVDPPVRAGPVRPEPRVGPRERVRPPSAPRPPVTEAVLTAAALAVLTGFIPGPYTAVVASTALDRGFSAGARLAMVPLVTDLPPLLVTSLVLRHLDRQVLGAVGIVGGTLVLLLGAWIAWHGGLRPGGGEKSGTEEAATFAAVATGGLLSPAPWLFWFVVASPLLLRSWHDSWQAGVAFAVTFFVVLIATAVAIAWGAARGRRAVSSRWRTRLTRATGVVLLVAGGVIVYQSAVGDFAEMIRRQQDLREMVEF